MIRATILISLFVYSAFPALSQSKKAAMPCHGSCCKGQSGNTNLAGDQKRVFACRLTTPELQKRRVEVIAGLKSKVIERKELYNGFSYLFAATDHNIDEVVSFVKTERLCCDFFHFEISIREHDLRLVITGEQGVKAFITDEIGL